MGKGVGVVKRALQYTEKTRCTQRNSLYAASFLERVGMALNVLKQKEN